jgi:hypothetical protein
LIVTPPASRGPPIDFGVLANSTATDTAVARQIQQRLAQKRDQRLAWLIKDLYEHRCMACGSRLAVGLDPERFYAEAAHIKPLGKPHNGPDVASNLLVLCPNHHLQFDRGVLSVQLHRASFRFVSHLTDDVAHHRPVSLRGTHTLDPRCVQWHSDFFSTVFAK